VHIAHITSSRFFGGPERQMLELAKELAPDVKSSFLSFSENGLCEGFLGQVRQAGFAELKLVNDTPHLLRAKSELTHKLSELKADVVCVHGYKAGLLGLYAARQLALPVIAISRGWTAESWKVRLYERLDRLALRHMDRVVCVSHGQAAKVRDTGVSPKKITVIHNAIRTERFQQAPDPQFRERLLQLFGEIRPRVIIGAAGRLSPEKGFNVLIEAAALFAQSGNADFGFVLFGDGLLRESLQRQIDAAGLSSRFILAGFTSELDQYMPHFDIFVQSSHTEGLPNVLLEAGAAGVPVVATDVGGTRELVVDGETGLMVPPGDPLALASNIEKLSANAPLQKNMGCNASCHVGQNFTFTAQAMAYRELFGSLIPQVAVV
jgi:glycosyltransferase involved in cell wall biosynthesis